MTPGKHRVEIVRPGFRTFDRDVDVAADQPTNVDVELEK